MPRGPSKTPRCAALDQNGVQCRRTKTQRYAYHGDNELYGHRDRADWVIVWLCMHHSDGITSVDADGDDS